MLVALVLTSVEVPGLSERDLPFPAWAFMAITFGVFLFLLLLLWSFKSIGKRH